ncbi:MAG: 16S rRNA (cytosine(1402)-N(4))-methyltransferase RsmH [Clostridia bacterium]|nr:16S rRNA (cytosine(1402)-N(4))-methyltransferase RsmH [Clostridia bacterium]
MYHIPVMLTEAVDALDVTPGGLYVDCTGGGGSHSAEILRRLGGTGLLIVIDRDPDAIAELHKRFDGMTNAVIVHDEYENIKDILESLVPGRRADGILVDIGSSSHQYDEVSRGFSYHADADAPLDMRMSQSGVSARDIVNNYSYEQLVYVISTLGDEKFAPRIASNIIKRRSEAPIETTTQLVDIIKASKPQKELKKRGHPAQKTFQALRDETNCISSHLEASVDAMFCSLNRGKGRLSILTFSSHEDRIVKTKFRSYASPCICPPELPVCVCHRMPLAAVNKSVTPSEAEIQNNPRARSARLRSLKKIRDTYFDDIDDADGTDGPDRLDER